jgi:hypothetical protein
MRPNLKTLVPLILLQTFIIGNAVAMFLGTWPVRLPSAEYSPQEKDALKTLGEIASKAQDDDLTADLALGTIYFLHNHLNQAEDAIQKGYLVHPEDPQVCALYQSIQAKKAGAMWDLAFGQIKLHRLRAALSALKACAQKAPDALDVQVFALASFAAVPQLGQNAKIGLELAQQLEMRLHNNHWTDAPAALTAPAWLAIARVYLYFAEHTPAQRAAWNAKAIGAWNAYLALNAAPDWLANDREFVAAKVAKQ